MESKIAVIGLGYVGLPLAIALAKSYKVVGYDVSEHRIREIKEGYDRTNEIESDVLKKSSLQVSTDANSMLSCDVFIVTVPTPVDDSNTPDLEPLRKASTALGEIITKGCVVVYESTVYPGVTEDFCGPILEKVSGLKAGVDFYLGYSPERINPGEKTRPITSILKITSGSTPQVAEQINTLYASVITAGTYLAPSIKVAEAAKA
ncbi:MAG: nucleotide sugar dehydrogenase, partial [Bacteroidota bacterium]